MVAIIFSPTVVEDGRGGGSKKRVISWGWLDFYKKSKFLKMMLYNISPLLREC